MKISEKNKQKLYNAIYENIVNLRLELEKLDKYRFDPFLDERLFKLNQNIWDEVKKELKFED